MSWRATVQRQLCNLGREADHGELSALCGSTLGFSKEPQEWPCHLSKRIALRTQSEHIKAFGGARRGERVHHS